MGEVVVGDIELVGDVAVGDIELVGDVVVGDIELVVNVVVGDIELVGNIVVGYTMYRISQAIMQLRKERIQTVLKDRNYHAVKYVEKSFGWFYRNI